MILPGVHIGSGAIIGANSVVGSDIAPYTVAIGNPARPVRRRFDEELISLLQWEWWNYPAEEIQSFIPILTCGDLNEVKSKIAAFLEKKNTASK